MILTSIQCVFIDFRFHRHVTSCDVIHPPFPCEGSGNTLGGAASVRGSIQHPVFSNLSMRGHVNHFMQMTMLMTHVTLLNNTSIVFAAL